MIDVIVPTYNRPEDIRKFVSEIRKQTYEDYKVIIIDDCGESSLHPFISEAGEHFQLIRLEKNGGQALARNVGISAGHGEIIVSLDDDAWFEEPDSLAKVVETLYKFPDTGCLMFDVRTPDRPRISAYKNIIADGTVIGSHITCGCAYRRDVLEKVGGFSGFLHSAAEESDLTFKIIKTGYKIRFSKEIKVFHNYVPGTRTDDWYFRTRYNTSRNDLMVVWMRYPLLYVLPFTAGKLFGHLRYVLKQKRKPLKAAGFVIASFFGALANIAIVFRNRSPLSINQFRNWLKIRW